MQSMLNPKSNAIKLALPQSARFSGDLIDAARSHLADFDLSINPPTALE